MKEEKKTCKSCLYFRCLITTTNLVDGCRCLMYGNDVEIDETTDADDCEEYKSNKEKQ